MATITEKTVREIALENPASIPVFESLGIDYCCGGKRPLSEACARAHIDTDRVLLLLAEAQSGAPARPAADWSAKPLRELTAHVVATHHAFVRREIPRISSLLAKVGAKHGESHPEISQIESLFTALGEELTAHLMKEEQVLFPYVERLEDAAPGGNSPSACFGSIEFPIARMVADHDDAGAILTRLRELSADYTPPKDACPTFLALYLGLAAFERDLHQHIHLENNILFPRAIAMERGL